MGVPSWHSRSASEEHGGPECPPRPTLPMTCSGVFRRVMFVAHYVHSVRSWRVFFILEELPFICAAREQGDRRVGVGVGAPVTLCRRRHSALEIICGDMRGRPCSHLSLSSPLPCQPHFGFSFTPSCRILSISFRITSTQPVTFRRLVLQRVPRWKLHALL